MSIIDVSSPMMSPLLINAAELPIPDLDSEDLDQLLADEPLPPPEAQESPQVVYSTPKIKNKVNPTKGVSGVTPITIFMSTDSDNEDPPKTPEYRNVQDEQYRDNFHELLIDTPCPPKSLVFEPTPWQKARDKIKKPPERKMKGPRKEKDIPTVLPTPVPVSKSLEMEIDINSIEFPCPFKARGITVFDKKEEPAERNNTNVEEIEAPMNVENVTNDDAPRNATDGNGTNPVNATLTTS